MELANAMLNEACRAPTARSRLAKRGNAISGGVVEAFAAWVRRGHAEYGALARETYIRVR